MLGAPKPSNREHAKLSSLFSFMKFFPFFGRRYKALIRHQHFSISFLLLFLSPQRLGACREPLFAPSMHIPFLRPKSASIASAGPLSVGVPLEGTDTVSGLRALERRAAAEGIARLLGVAAANGETFLVSPHSLQHCS